MPSIRPAFADLVHLNERFQCGLVHFRLRNCCQDTAQLRSRLRKLRILLYSLAQCTPLVLLRIRLHGDHDYKGTFFGGTKPSSSDATSLILICNTQPKEVLKN